MLLGESRTWDERHRAIRKVEYIPTDSESIRGARSENRSRGKVGVSKLTKPINQWNVPDNRLSYWCMAFFLYILESQRDGSFYVGTTNNLEDRIRRHNEGRVKYTKAKGPFRLVYSENHSDRSSAMKREYAIKRHKRKNYIVDLVHSFNSD